MRRVGLTRKGGSLAILIFAQIAILSLWFSSTAVLPEMAVESGVAADDLVWLSTAVPLGFAIGALIYAALGLADRYDPRGVFMLSALAGAMANLALLIVPIGGWEAIALRGITGATMAGVYPVGMKIAAGWGKSDRALLVSLLIDHWLGEFAFDGLIRWRRLATDDLGEHADCRYRGRRGPYRRPRSMACERPDSRYNRDQLDLDQ